MKSKNFLSRVRKSGSGGSRSSTLTVMAFFALLVALFTTALPALAANQVVSDCGDSGGANQLRAKLAAAQSGGGGIITFSCAGPIALNSTFGALSVSSNVTIEGGSGMTLSGGNATRVFIVSSGSLTLNNVTVTKGYAAGDGGAIIAGAALSLNNTHFLDNHVTSGSGGAIRATAALNITNSEFASNTATNGGALYLKWGGGVANITGSNFHNNQADGNGGEGGAVLLFDGASATVSNSTFMSNTTDYGGVFFIYQPTSNPTTLALSNSTLSYNQTGKSGGAIYNGGTITLTGGTLSWNTGHVGGGIFNYGTASLTNVMLTSNHADSYSGGVGRVGSGGGIVNYQNSTLTLTSVTFSSNVADNVGGAVHNAGTLTANNSTFSSNTAFYGGGIYNEENASALSLTASTLDHNGAVAGGGIHNTGTVTLTNVTLSANTATKSASGGQSEDGTGGGLLNYGGVVTLLNVTFKSNSTNGGGEAINNPAAQSGTLTLTNSLVSKAGATNDSCLGNISGSFNYADDSSCPLSVVADLKLGALANNGGTTKTHLPGAGSAAIDNGTGANCPAKDQRGITRPQGLACDVGSVEVQPASPTPTPTLTPTATPTAACGTPAKPVLTAPQKGASTTKTKVPLKWDAVSCATTYKVVVKQDTKKGTTVFSATVATTTKKTSALAKGHTYYWTVSACNAANQCTKSAVWSFQVK